MARTLGVDHGTGALRFCLLDGEEKSFFEVERSEAANTSVANLLGDTGFLDVDLIGLTYSMADGINSITDIQKVEGRGQQEALTGRWVGGGTRFFDELKGLKIPSYLIPGLHRDISCLDHRFKVLYSHMAASEKVALSYHVHKKLNREKEVNNIVISDISSNTVTIGIKEARFFGAIDACLGAPGLLHGPLDLDLIRKVDREVTSANNAFYNAGLAGRTGLNQGDILRDYGHESGAALDALLMAVQMEIAGLASVVMPEAIAIAGSAGVHPRVYPKLKQLIGHIAPVHKMEVRAAAIGAAEIAGDILEGKKDFLGIGIDS